MAQLRLLTLLDMCLRVSLLSSSYTPSGRSSIRVVVVALAANVPLCVRVGRGEALGRVGCDARVVARLVAHLAPGTGVAFRLEAEGGASVVVKVEPTAAAALSGP